MIYGIVWGKATIDCPEGSATFDDAKAYYWQIIDGTYSATYSAASAALKTKMMMEHPGERSYVVDSSWFSWGKTASHAVIIDYTKTLQAWNCRPYIITKGYGTSYESALANALQSKANNDSASAPYKELKHVTWTPAQ